MSDPPNPTRRALPDWPRALRVTHAAAYVGVSEPAVRNHVAPDLRAIHVTPRTTAWLREDLDAWLDAKAGRVAASEDINPWLA